MSKKKLDTRDKRKRVIKNLFKKDEYTGKIIMKNTLQILYESYDKDVQITENYIDIFDIVKKNYDYTELFVKSIVFYPDNDVEHTKMKLGTRNYSIVYNKNLDHFVVTSSMHINTYSQVSLFNYSKRFYFNVWENENMIDQNNAFVGIRKYQRASSFDLDTNISKLIQENSFEELYKIVWSQNHINKYNIITAESIRIDGIYQVISDGGYSIIKNKPILLSPMDREAIIKQEKNSRYFNWKYLTKKEDNQHDLRLGALIKENEKISAICCGTDKDNGSYIFNNIEYDENRRVTYFEVVYYESGTVYQGKDHEQWPGVMIIKFFRKSDI
jgi:hypothetical protein